MSKLAALLILAALASPALADNTAKTEARLHIDKASAFHKDGKYQEALDELTVAYSLDPQPSLLYAIGQVHVKLGHCKLAIAFYERFLTTKPDEGPAGAAHEAIATCKQIGDMPPQSAPPDKQPPPPPDTPPPPPPTTSVVRGSDGIWYHDVIGDALAGGGVVVAIMAGVVYLGAQGKLDDADRATSYASQQALVDTAHTDRLFSVVLVAGGAALIGAAVYHYIRYTDHARAPQIGVTAAPGGAFASFALRF